MKKFTLFIILTSIVSIIQAQSTCATAVSLNTSTTCNYTSHTTSGDKYFFKFVATSPTVNVSLVTTKFGIDAPHIHNLALASGTCSNLTVIADDELPFVADAKELAIDLNASGLIVGQTYYLRAARQATHTNCDKAGCTANSSTAPTTFDICIQDIEVIIPLDFGLELPASDHSYTTNRGQLIDVNGNPVPDIKLYNDKSVPAVYIAEDKVSYVFAEINPDTTDTLHRVDATLVGGNATKIFKTERTEGITNYYLGHIPHGVTGNKSYSRAVCNEVYSDIDMQYYSNQDGVKFYFIVKPGGDANDIIIQYDGANAINVTPNGGLEIVTSLGKLDFEPPHAYRINPAGNPVPMPWQCKFEAVPNTTNQVKFKVHNYDPIMPLIIQVDRGHSQKGFGNAEWCTYIEGGGDDFGIDITNDGNGNTYVVGQTNSSNFPFTTGAFQAANAGSIDAFVAAFNDDYSQLWATYYGGDDNDLGRALTHSAFDNKIYICGQTRGNAANPITMLSAGPSSYVDTNQFYNASFIARFGATTGFIE